MLSCLCVGMGSGSRDDVLAWLHELSSVQMCLEQRSWESDPGQKILLPCCMAVTGLSSLGWEKHLSSVSK